MCPHVLDGWELDPSDRLSRLHHSPESLAVEGGAATIPGGVAARQDTLIVGHRYGVSVEVGEDLRGQAFYSRLRKNRRYRAVLITVLV